MKKITCIVPAYNEEKTIEKVLDVVCPLVGHYLYEVIVVDDGSTDNTKSIISKFDNVIYLEQLKNKGKSKSVANAIKIAKGDYIFLLDADLKFLKANNIIDIIQPIEDGVADVSISYRKNSWPLFPFKSIDYLSGERIILKTYLLDKITEMSFLPSYGLEVFINRIIISNKLNIKIVQWTNVENTFSQEKRGWFKGIQNVIKVWLNVLSVISIFEMYYQNMKMKELMLD